MGSFADPSIYTELRYDMHRANLAAQEKFASISRDFAKAFGRDWGGSIDEYLCDDAEIIIVAAGSIMGTIKEAVDEMRAKGKKVGALKLRLYRPFPHADLQDALKNARAVCVIEKCLSYGYGGIISAEVRSTLYGKSDLPVLGFTIGLGGRDIRTEEIVDIVGRAEKAADGGEYEAQQIPQVNKEAF
jgi:pyruvate ferredoxin oxidoreductase alpha subunit